MKTLQKGEFRFDVPRHLIWKKTPKEHGRLHAKKCTNAPPKHEPCALSMKNNTQAPLSVFHGPEACRSCALEHVDYEK